MPLTIDLGDRQHARVKQRDHVGHIALASARSAALRSLELNPRRARASSGHHGTAAPSPVG